MDLWGQREIEKGTEGEQEGSEGCQAPCPAGAISSASEFFPYIEQTHCAFQDEGNGPRYAEQQRLSPRVPSLLAFLSLSLSVCLSPSVPVPAQGAKRASLPVSVSLSVSLI